MEDDFPSQFSIYSKNRVQDLFNFVHNYILFQVMN